MNTNSQLVGDIISTGSDNRLILLGSGTKDANFVGNSVTIGLSSVSMSGDIWPLSCNINQIGSAVDTWAVNAGMLIFEGTGTQARYNGGASIGSVATLQFENNSATGIEKMNYSRLLWKISPLMYSDIFVDYLFV